ncbi:ABC transporter permease [Vibrio rhodolitus]|uniref:ABC transporter permease n=1 Tax=Vibrio rhodolitus TaxID=2231649 RepID=UPI000E0BFBE3|nr:ABC transporter permease [Vibrio rhodolitus]
MSSVVDIDWLILALFFGTLLVPLAISRHFKLRIETELVISVSRMCLQLILVGIYLEYLFLINNLYLNLLWLAIMLLVGSSSIVSKARLPKNKLLLPVISGLVVGLLPLLTFLCLSIIKPVPYYNAQYLIPLAGMLLGNCLSGNIIALQNLFACLEQRRDEYEAAISLGAAPKYAMLPFVQEALQKSLAPSLASMSTMGLVTLPGMMTGQILGGTSPVVAIKYQLMIMVAIFVMLSVSVAITLSLTITRCINKQGRVLASPLKK